jgi:hypothetical protein
MRQFKPINRSITQPPNCSTSNSISETAPWSTPSSTYSSYCSFFSFLIFFFWLSFFFFLPFSSSSTYSSHPPSLLHFTNNHCTAYYYLNTLVLRHSHIYALVSDMTTPWRHYHSGKQYSPPPSSSYPIQLLFRQYSHSGLVGKPSEKDSSELHKLNHFANRLGKTTLIV